MNTMAIPALRRQAGLSLIEMMVAITIGLFLMVGLVSVFSTSNQTYMDLGRASQQIENGRFAMQILVDDVSNAGFYGRYSLTPTMPASADPCETTDPNVLQSSLALPIQGYSPVAGAGSPITACLPNANYLTSPGTDILVVRRAESNLAGGDGIALPLSAFAINNGQLTAGNWYVQANANPAVPAVLLAADGTKAGDEGKFTLKSRVTTPPAPIAPVRKYHVHIYFIAPCSVPAGGGSDCTGAADDNGRPIPTLKRLELAASGAQMNLVPLVEGIENLQIDYGIDNDGDGVPDSFLALPAAFASWQDVVAVRINVLSRQIEPSPSYTDSKTYDMGVEYPAYAPGGSYKRHVYNAVVRVVNPAARRE